MSWRETWRATVESFLRELDGADDGMDARAPVDPIVSAIAGARAEVSSVERELASVAQRLAHEEQAAAMCERRRALAERIGDVDTAAVAERFRARHAARAAVLTRKRDVLRDELVLARSALNDLLDYARAEEPLSGPPAEGTG